MAAAPNANDERVAQLVAEGNAAVEAGKFEDAVAKYTEAQSLKANYDVAGNLGAVEMELHRYRDAAQHLWDSLRDYPPTGSDDAKLRTQQLLARARAEVAAVKLKLNVAAAEIRIDGRYAGRSPHADPFFVEPGSHVVEALHPDYENARTERTFEKGSESDVDFVMTPRRRDGTGGAALPWWPGLLVAGVGAVGVAAGGGLFAAAKAKGSNARDSAAKAGGCPSGSPAPACDGVDATLSSADGLMRGSWIAFGAGSALLAGGVVFAVVAATRRAQPPQGAISISPVVGAQGSGVAVGGSFF